MSDRYYIPRSIKAFAIYLAQTCGYLILGTPTNAVRFNWTTANLTAWQNFLSLWTPLFNLYTNKKGGYTTSIKIKLEGIIANAIIYAENNKLIELIKATVSLNSDDCITFHLPTSLVIPPTGIRPVPKIKELDKTIITLEGVYPKLLPELNGLLHIKAFPEKAESGRPHKLKGYDLLEYAFGVFYLGSLNLPTQATDTRLTVGYSSKSNFVLATVTNTSNLTALAANALTPVKIVIIFFRWAKSKHPTLDGPWNGPFISPLM
jgi:hypothetical protein